MDPSIEEAVTLKTYAEKRFIERDYVGARYYASKAQTSCPQLEGIAQMVTTFGVHAASEMKIGGELDFYAILGVDPSVDKAKLKKQYRKMAVLLHPDKNKTVGADGAFRLVSDAWTLLSDSTKRNSYDHRRSYGRVSGYDTGSKSSVSNRRLDTFWTICTSCHVQYEYLRKYVNKRLSCKNCRGVFVAAETGVAPANGSFPYCPSSYVAENGHGSYGCTYTPTTSTFCASSGISGHHSVQGSEYVTNLSFQWNSGNDLSAGASNRNVSSMPKGSIIYQENVKANKVASNGVYNSPVETVYVASNGYNSYTVPPATKPTRRPYKQRRVDSESSDKVSSMEFAKPVTLVTTASGNGNLKTNSKLFIPSDNWARQCIDTRQLLIDKARSVILKKLKEYKHEVAVTEVEKKKSVETEVRGLPNKRTGSGKIKKKANAAAISVPDSDYHDFDKDRSEECFQPKQIWALYDEEDGMPRLYCLIRDIISMNPFKIYISYLSSKTDAEFGSVNWLNSGVTKSCGNFRVFSSDIVDQVNIFSHLLGREKAGRGGCIRIYPRAGDIWAVYRNWSPYWNKKTPVQERHQYEMVVVLNDYSEELGVRVAPLTKLDGYNTVYQRNPNSDAIRRIPRREMLRFSHPVPSCFLKGVPNLPDNCWDLDPAATPDELLQKENKLQNEGSHFQKFNSDATLYDDPSPGGTSVTHADEKLSQTSYNRTVLPNDCPEMFT